MCKLLRCKLKCKVIREAILVSFYRLNQNFHRNAVKFGKLLSKQNFLAANEENEILNPFHRNQFIVFLHFHLELPIILRSQTVTSSFHS